ncbi:MAG: 6,7-dimethyl-8-ribityllumazine synthase [Ignavibacteriaceae bacterium]
MRIIQGNLSAANYRFAVILSRFNESIGNKLLDGALKCLIKYGCAEDNIDLIKVPGAFEIPLTAEKLAEQNKYNAIICLGAVIRGGTPHFEYVAGSAARGILQVSLKTKIPVIFGILTTDTYQQAVERSAFSPDQLKEAPAEMKETGSGNKGWDAALTAIEMADLFSKIK